MIEINFTVPGKPVPKGRPRSFIRNGHVGHYTPKETVSYENLVRMAASQAMGDSAITSEGIFIKVLVFLPIPKSWSMKKQRAAALGDIKPISRPDLDNIVKAIKDGANSVVWRDDSQVISLIASKRYGDPRVEVTARW